MKTSLFVLSTSLIVTIACAGSAKAVEVFDGGGPGYHPTGGYTQGTNLTNRILACDFELTAAARVTDVRFWTLEPYPNEFDGGIKWCIFEGADKKPSADILHNGLGILRSRTPQSTAGFQYDFSLDNPVSLDANKRYWLGMKLQNSTFAASIFWAAAEGWLDSPIFSSYFGEPGRLSFTLTEPVNWGPAGNYNDWGFKLYSNVPEPAAWLMFCVGLMLTSARPRRRSA